MGKIVSKLRTNQDTFGEINCRVRTTWRVDGWRKKSYKQSALIKAFKQYSEIHSNCRGEGTSGERLDILSTHR